MYSWNGRHACCIPQIPYRVHASINRRPGPIGLRWRLRCRRVLNIMTISLIITIVVATIEFAVIVVGIIHIIEHNRPRVNTLSWSKTALASQSVLQKSLNKFKPDVILSLYQESTMLVSLAEVMCQESLPICAGITMDKKAEVSESLKSQYQTVTTSKWKLLIPNSILSMNTKKILIFDDCVINGDCVAEAVKLLIQNGFERTQLQTCAPFCTQQAVEASKQPDIYWNVLPDNNFEFPWGSGYSDRYI